ncbi:F-box/LRR-repeat protein 12 [Discoglossus pictus]
MSTHPNMSATVVGMANTGDLGQDLSVTPTLSWLPDNLLLEVLKYLSVKELIRSSRVCIRWKRLVADRALWKHVDLTPYRLHSKLIWHLLRHWMGNNLQSLKITGVINSLMKCEFLTVAVFLEMSKRFPELKNLHLVRTNFRSVNYDCLPSTLKTLELVQCELPLFWFKRSPGKRRVLPLLETLIITDVSSFSNYHMDIICSHSALKTLLLSGTYRVNDLGVQKASNHLSELEHLKLQGCNISDNTLHLIGRQFNSLKTLDLTNICTLTEDGLFALSGLKNLEKLWIEYCCSLYAHSVISVCNSLPALTFLHLNGLFEGQSIDDIVKGLPNCTVKSSCSLTEIQLK